MDGHSTENAANRRRFLVGGGATLAGTVTASMMGSQAVAAESQPAQSTADSGPLRLTHGVVTGDVTLTSAMIWARGSREGTMQVLYGSDEAQVAGQQGLVSETVTLTAERDFIGQVTLRDLTPGTRYFYMVRLQGEDPTVRRPIATFVTAPKKEDQRDVHFVWSGDTGSGFQNPTPYPTFASMLAENPEFFIFNGDTIYGDVPTAASGPATSREMYWAKYKEMREDPYLQTLASRVPFIVNWDDHEVTDGFRGPSEPLMPIGRQAFHDYWPISSGPERIYRSIRWGKELEVFVVDGRQYASPLDAPDGPNKILFGAEQRKWLVDSMRSSNATWKVIVTSSPISIIRSTPPVDDYVAYEHEFGLLMDDFQKIKAKNVVWITADVHWAQAIEYPRYGMWEFVGCPIGSSQRTKSEPLSPTFGPEERFIALNGRYYGSVSINSRNRTMTVQLKRQSGEPVYSVDIPAR
ncbi:alkaline phosphatase D family protein [Saccharopolyspora sp. K220]|uniref:alkaline phosphatase D family protein n=1 Tax=Saccharopolyspora soli TaxID=2926618 RepID=UPI001F5AAD65|nr:alkaline phosphatase D family protein [Saccharopolyspora soli]MCI2422327.1 alkaline phosphatase D family protein [Saccharopolyspora soli]